MTAPESVPEVRDEWVGQVHMALIQHEAVGWKITEPGPTSDGKSEAGCLCGWFGDTADFRSHVARAALAAVVPLIEAEARRPHARLVRELKALAGEYESYPAWDRPARDLRNLLARAVATGDEGGQR